MLDKQTLRQRRVEETVVTPLLGQSLKRVMTDKTAAVALFLPQGTKNAARYNTATFRVTVGAQLAGAPPAPVEPSASVQCKQLIDYDAQSQMETATPPQPTTQLP